MRSAKAQDHWKDAYKRQYKDNFLEIDLNGLNNLPKMQFSNGIIAICGLNGAGKSTIISAIKDLIGLQLTGQDLHKLCSHAVNGIALSNGKEVLCSNQDKERLSDKGWNIDNVRYIDCEASTNAQTFLIRQSNLDELLEQYEEYEMTSEEIKEINYLVGKGYYSCGVRELDDIDGQDSAIPYFHVAVGDTEYDTTSMGNGEHFLLFLFWCINRVDKDTLLIIEEPETYISISSQMHFANYLGKQMAKKGVKVILTTHSPYILGNIKNENIRIVSRMGNNVSIVTPNESMPAESILGISRDNVGTFFVEDRVAADLLAVILEDKAPYLLRQYSIDIAGCESAISERLKFPNSEKIKYNFIGVYDGDMRDTLDKSKLNWKYCFLPGKKAIEEVFRDYLHEPSSVAKLCDCLAKDEGRMITILATLEGLDCHDWFDEFRKALVVEGRTLVNAFYQSIMKDEEAIERFMTELQLATNG
jgi:predicted ATPase